MIDDHPTEFFCPRCGSRYKVVRVQADADLPHRLIHCKVCKQPLTPADGEYALKYFLVEKALKHNGVDLRMSHVPKGEASKPRVGQADFNLAVSTSQLVSWLPRKATVTFAATKCSPANVHTSVIKSFVRAAHSAAGGRQGVRRVAPPRRTRTWGSTDGKRAGFSTVREPPPNLVATKGTTT